MFLFRPIITRMSSSPAAAASSTTYWMAGLSTTGSISFGVAFVAGRKRVPRPAAGITALRTVRVEAGVEVAWGTIMGAWWPTGMRVPREKALSPLCAGPGVGDFVCQRACGAHNLAGPFGVIRIWVLIPTVTFSEVATF